MADQQKKKRGRPKLTLTPEQIEVRRQKQKAYARGYYEKNKQSIKTRQKEKYNTQEGKEYYRRYHQQRKEELQRQADEIADLEQKIAQLEAAQVN
jgi:hypothetical protein